MVQIDDSDFLKIKDALDAATKFHARRDEMNAAVHLAGEVRYSPLTSSLLAQSDRMSQLSTQLEGFAEAGT